ALPRGSSIRSIGGTSVIMMQSMRGRISSKAGSVAASHLILALSLAWAFHVPPAGAGQDADASLDRLREALRNDDPRIRATAAISVRDGRLAADLGALLADPVPGVRAAAVSGLGGLEGDEALGYVLAATADADPSVAQAALDVLGARRDPRAVPRAERLVGSTQPAIRGAAARALVLLDALPLRRAAVERALADREPAVQLAVLDGFRE